MHQRDGKGQPASGQWSEWVLFRWGMRTLTHGGIFTKKERCLTGGGQTTQRAEVQGTSQNASRVVCIGLRASPSA